MQSDEKREHERGSNGDQHGERNEPARIVRGEKSDQIAWSVDTGQTEANWVGDEPGQHGDEAGRARQRVSVSTCHAVESSAANLARGDASCTQSTRS